MPNRRNSKTGQAKRKPTRKTQPIKRLEGAKVKVIATGVVPTTPKLWSCSGWAGMARRQMYPPFWQSITAPR